MMVVNQGVRLHVKGKAFVIWRPDPFVNATIHTNVPLHVLKHAGLLLIVLGLAQTTNAIRFVIPSFRKKLILDSVSIIQIFLPLPV